MQTNPIGHNNPPSDAETLQWKLRDDHHIQLTNAQKLVEAAGRMPTEITDEETAGKATDFIKMVTGSRKAIEALRVNEKEPYLTLGRVVDGFFKVVTDSLDGAKNKAQRPLDNYLKEQADIERRKRIEEAAELRRKAEEEAMTAAAMEKAKQTDAAADMLSQASISELGANRLDKIAEAKPADLAKSRGVSGALASLRTWWVGEIVDIDRLHLDTLRHHINPDALQKAVNSYVAAGGRILAGAKIFEKSETVVR